MNTVVCYALSRSIIPAARYLQIASSIDAGILPADESLAMKFDPNFEPCNEWKEAVVGFYKSLSGGIGGILNMDGRYPDWIDIEDVRPWLKAEEVGEFERFGWAHRIINEMINVRRNNGGSDLGDHESRLMMRVLKDA